MNIIYLWSVSWIKSENLAENNKFISIETEYKFNPSLSILKPYTLSQTIILSDQKIDFQYSQPRKFPNLSVYIGPDFFPLPPILYSSYARGFLSFSDIRGERKTHVYVFGARDATRETRRGGPVIG